MVAGGLGLVLVTSRGPRFWRGCVRILRARTRWRLRFCRPAWCGPCLRVA